MTFYNDKEPSYIETDMSGVGLEASLLHLRDGKWLPKDEVPDNTAPWQIPFASNNLTTAETQYSNIEKEVLGIFHNLKKFYH